MHALQVALNKHGYNCGDDDAVWWQFGMDTQSSLLTFQVVTGYTVFAVHWSTAKVNESIFPMTCALLDRPATSCRKQAWRMHQHGKALLGADAEPSDIIQIKSGDSTDEDMQGTERVWLLGEQRWEVKRAT